MANLRRYLAEIGARGGRKSRRTLDAEAARNMVKVREARRAFRRFRSSCFRPHRPDLKIGLADVPWVAEQLRKHGDREARQVAARLCQAAAEPDPVIEAYKQGLDRSLLRENLRKTPTERVAALMELQRLAAEARRAGRIARQ